MASQPLSPCCSQRDRTGTRASELLGIMPWGQRGRLETLGEECPRTQSRAHPSSPGAVGGGGCQSCPGLWLQPALGTCSPGTPKPTADSSCQAPVSHRLLGFATKSTFKLHLDSNSRSSLASAPFLAHPLCLTHRRAPHMPVDLERKLLVSLPQSAGPRPPLLLLHVGSVTGKLLTHSSPKEGE